MIAARLTVALMVVALGACTTAAPPSPIPPELDLRGTWEGTWGGAPAALTIIDQVDDQPYSGVFLGPLMVMGRTQPGVSGILTYTVRGALTSVQVVGWLAGSPTNPTLRIQGQALDGTVVVLLRRMDETRFAGMGESSFAWGPQGPVELVRRAG